MKIKRENIKSLKENVILFFEEKVYGYRDNEYAVRLTLMKVFDRKTPTSK